MSTLQVPSTTYTLYELTKADETALLLFLNLNPLHRVYQSHEENELKPQKVLAIKWFRERFDCELKKAKEGVDAFYALHTTKAPAEPEAKYSVIGYIEPFGRHIFDDPEGFRKPVYMKND